MAKLLSALIFAAALIFGLGTVSSTTYACNEQSAQAGDDLIQLAQDESSDESSDDATDEEDSGESSSGDGE